MSVGQYNITYIAADPSGNNATCTFLFSVVAPLAPDTAASSSGTPTTAVAGAAGGAALLLIAFLAIFFVLRVRRDSKKVSCV